MQNVQQKNIISDRVKQNNVVLTIFKTFNHIYPCMEQALAKRCEEHSSLGTAKRLETDLHDPSKPGYDLGSSAGMVRP